MQIVEQWTKTGLINNFPEEKKENIAKCLQAQVDFNEEVEGSAQFNRLSVPLLVRMFAESKAFNRNHFSAGQCDDREIVTHMFKRKYDPPKVDGVGTLDKEAEYVAELSENLMREVDVLFGDKFNKYIEFHGISLNFLRVLPWKFH